MPPDDFRDRLVDTLLDEVLGGEQPPDLTGRVVSKAFPGDRRHLGRYVLAAAAVAAVAVLGWWLLRPGYPRPQASGAYHVVGGGAVRRGATVRTEQGRATLTLGGYCSVALDPQSSVRLEGSDLAEQVFLGRGGVLCDVDLEVGTFAVRTAVGTASAAGTRFAVELIEEKGDDEMVEKRMLVRVLAGVVLVSGAGPELALARGQEKLVPPRKTRPARIPKTMVTLSHVDDSAEGQRSLGASGHAAEFERPEGGRFVEAVQIFASRYGSPKPPKENFHVYVLDDKRQALADVGVPYATVERGDLRWYTLRTPSIEVTERFTIALAFNPGRTKGIRLGLDQSVETSHSLIGLPDSGFERITERHDWMIRVVLSAKPTGKKGIRRLADRKPVQKGDPLKGRIEVKYDAGKSDGRKSMGGAGPAVRIKAADVAPKGAKAQNLTFHGLRLYASRYGSGYNLDETVVRAAVLGPDGKVLWKGTFPYARFTYRAKWVDLALEEPADLGKLPDGTLTLALDPQAQRTRGVYFHYAKDPETSHAAMGSLGRGFKDAPDMQWLIRAYFSVEPASDF